jgi:hypothetical protein
MQKSSLTNHIIHLGASHNQVMRSHGKVFSLPILLRGNDFLLFQTMVRIKLAGEVACGLRCVCGGQTPYHCFIHYRTRNPILSRDLLVKLEVLNA